MIPAIGYMVGAYIVTRMLALLAREEAMNVRAAAIFTIMVTVGCVIWVAVSSAEATQALGG